MKGNTAKSKKLLFEGRSTLLNVLLIVLNVMGICLLLNPWFIDASSGITLKLIGGALFALSLVFLAILKGFYMYAYFARLTLAVVLLISGFGKLNDPIGFAQVLEQYFQDGALSLKMGQSFGWNNYSLEPYVSWTLKISIALAFIEILLALMLLYHMLYKLAAFLLLPLVLVFSYVSFYTSTCDEQQTYVKQFSIQENDENASKLLARSETDSTLVFKGIKNKTLQFSETKNNVCINNCGCLGESNHGFFGFELTKELSFSRNLILLFFTLILFVTQFWMLPNAPFESTLFGICAWIALLVHGILSGWFWLVVLSGVVLYLATNVRRFGVKILKTSLGSLAFVSVLLGGVLYYVISFEPLSDFRAYAIGSSLSIPSPNEQKSEMVYVYQHKFTNKMVFLSEETYNNSPILADSNYVFVRVKEHKINPFENPSASKFRPILAHADILKYGIEHPFVELLLSAYSEELFRVFNKQTGRSDVFHAREFGQELYNDTNFVIEKFVGIHDDNAQFDLSKSLVASDLIFIWVVKDMHKISSEEWINIRELSQKIKEQEYDIVALGYQRLNLWHEKSELDLNSLLYLNLERTELNQICRSNVCLMVLRKGIVEAKYPLRGLPKYETISSKLRLE